MAIPEDEKMDAKKMSAKERILQAAASVFASEGIKGATTREIVRVAGVNESTLFRHFQNKEELLRVVVENTVTQMTAVMSDIELGPRNLREDLLYFAKAANQQMEKNEAIIRTLIGEMERQPEHAQRVVESAKKPLTDKLMAYFQDKQNKKLLRSDLPLPIILDIFSGLLMVGMLKRPVTQSKYSTEQYLETVVDTLIRGIGA